MLDETVVTFADSPSPAGDDLRSLRNWLSDVDELRGRVHVRSHPQPGTLGVVPEALVVAGPMVVALVPALISWIRSRHTEVRVEVSRGDGTTVTLTAGQVRRLGPGDLTRLIDDIARSGPAGASGLTASPQAGTAPEADRAGESDG